MLVMYSAGERLLPLQMCLCRKQSISSSNTLQNKNTDATLALILILRPWIQLESGTSMNQQMALLSPRSL
jgi:hypothetical protein